MSIGTYATKAAMLARFGTTELVQASNLDVPIGPDPVAINDTTLTDALDEANSIVDGYVQSKYTLPISPIPPSLVAKACDLARYALWKFRSSERVTEGKDSAISFLKDVAKGIVALGPTSTTIAPSIAVGATSFVDPDDPEMDTSNMNDYRFPSGGQY